MYTDYWFNAMCVKILEIIIYFQVHFLSGTLTCQYLHVSSKIAALMIHGLDVLGSDLSRLKSQLRISISFPIHYSLIILTYDVLCYITVATNGIF